MPPLSMSWLPHMVQAPSEQAMLAPHALPHAEQLLASESRFASQPSCCCPLQLAKPGRQESSTQTLLMHTDLALGILHCGQVQLCCTHTSPCAHLTPQPPQLLASLSMFCSQPFGVLLSQLAQPGLQAAMPHMLPKQ